MRVVVAVRLFVLISVLGAVYVQIAHCRHGSGRGSRLHNTALAVCGVCRQLVQDGAQLLRCNDVTIGKEFKFLVNGVLAFIWLSRSDIQLTALTVRSDRLVIATLNCSMLMRSPVVCSFDESDIKLFRYCWRKG